MGARRACCFVGRLESRRLFLRRQTSLMALVVAGLSACNVATWGTNLRTKRPLVAAAASY